MGGLEPSRGRDSFGVGKIWACPQSVLIMWAQVGPSNRVLDGGWEKAILGVCKHGHACGQFTNEPAYGHFWDGEWYVGISTTRTSLIS